MKLNKGKIVVMILSGVVLLSILSGAAILLGFSQNGESSMDTRKRKVTATNLEAKSYEQIYRQLLMVKLKDYLHNRYYFNTEEADAPASKIESATEDALNTSNKKVSSDFGETNVQVQGIDEGDIIKNDGKYLYCYEKNRISIVQVDGDDMRVCSKIKGYENLEELYVSGNKLVLISQKGSCDIICYDEDLAYEDSSKIDNDKKEELQVVIDVYDITDRKNPVLLSTKKQDGMFQTSRIRDGYLYIITSKNMYIENMKKEDPSTYVPKVDDKTLEYSDVLIPDTSILEGYLLLTGLKIDNPTVFSDQKAILSNGYNYYVSTGNIYIAENLYEKSTTKTLLTKIAYKDGRLKVKKQGKIQGYLNNNFSMDEYKGYLRVVTTVNRYDDNLFQMYNNLYVLNNELKIVGSIEKLAKNETIYSARFMGDTGYFVTFRQVDPLFSVDLSNPTKPKVMDALKIPGFSSYLHFYGEGLLLGIGEDVDVNTGAFKGVKLSMFDISNPYDVKEVHKCNLGEGVYSKELSNYKSILIDDKSNIIGFSYMDGSYEDSRPTYAVYSYHEKMGFMKDFSVREETWCNANLRGTYIGDTFYFLHLPWHEEDSDEKSYIAAYHRKDYQLLKKLYL